MITLPDCHFHDRRLFFGERRTLSIARQQQLQVALNRVSAEVRDAFRAVPRVSRALRGSIQEVFDAIWERVPPHERYIVLHAVARGERSVGPEWAYDLLHRLRDAEQMFRAELDMTLGEATAQTIWFQGLIGSCVLTIDGRAPHDNPSPVRASVPGLRQ